MHCQREFEWSYHVRKALPSFSISRLTWSKKMLFLRYVSFFTCTLCICILTKTTTDCFWYFSFVKSHNSIRLLVNLFFCKWEIRSSEVETSNAYCKILRMFNFIKCTTHVKNLIDHKHNWTEPKKLLVPCLAVTLDATSSGKPVDSVNPSVQP